jgi:hypothetical protein
MQTVTLDPSSPRAALPDTAGALDDAVRELAERVHASHLRVDFREDAFAEIATGELARARLAERFGPADLYTWAVRRRTLPPQLDAGSTFGEPPLTLYWGERFVIDAYTWFSSTTSIHQHAFAGAFGVLSGGSVHTTYRFREEERINVRLQRGTLDIDAVEWLAPGDVRTIHPGRMFIHSLFHLEHPSVSIVVRTNRDEEHNPQYAYLHPGISYDPFFVDRLDRRRNEVFRALAKVAPERYAAEVTARLDELDLSGAFFAVQGAYWALLEHKALFARVRERALDVHGARLEPYLASIERMLRDRHLTTLRKKVKDPDLRVFMALLLNVPTGEQILRLLAQRYPQTPPDVRATELTLRLLGEADLGFALDDVQRDVFALALRKLPFEVLVDEIKRTYDDDDVERARPRLARFLRALAEPPIIAPLFS